ncbi:Hypothetical predicted protein [Octopus vulgaris]|uniref:Secreted protein n=1 Tax=Octopus vulgaris TaxID=6645 RepID=A0AA36EYS3_OCTVU|nr:Hypothetical predicted protein [Octopus vulgaris]
MLCFVMLLMPVVIVVIIVRFGGVFCRSGCCDCCENGCGCGGDGGDGGESLSTQHVYGKPKHFYKRQTTDSGALRLTSTCCTHSFRDNNDLEYQQL